MIYKKRLKKCISISLSLVLFISYMIMPKILPVFATTIDENKSKQSSLQNQNQKLQQQIKNLKNNVEEKNKYKETLSKQIEVVQQQIDLINEQINELDNSIKGMQQQIIDTEQSIEEGMEILRKRVRALYVAGETSTLDIILGAKDFSDFLDKAEMVKVLSDHDNELIEDLKNNVKEIENEKSSVERQKNEVYEQKKQLDTKQNELQSLFDESQKVIEELEGKQSQILDKIDENNEELNKINKEIEEYYAKQSLNNKSSSKNQVISASGSAYTWPVPGYYYISSDYYDTVGRKSMHRAIDIAGAGIYGKSVVAANSGTIIFCNTAGYGGGYGKYIIIDHGNGRSTLYAHLSAVNVSKGQTVQKGEVIGKVGSTGFSTGPHLHFETRLNGVKYNPMNEFPE